MPPIPSVTKALILACVGVFCLTLLLAGGEAQIDLLLFNTPFELWPLNSGRFMPWQLITYAFLHGGWQHIFFNMLGLWMIGSELERYWGAKRYIQMLVACTLTAAITQLAVTWLMQSNAPTIGISGAIYGLLISFGILFPDSIIVPIFPPIPMKAKVFVAIFGGIELYLGVTTHGGGGVAHVAHLGGMLGAWLLIRYWRSSGRRR